MNYIRKIIKKKKINLGRDIYKTKFIILYENKEKKKFFISLHSHPPLHH
jgi:hypothetical protein